MATTHRDPRRPGQSGDKSKTLPCVGCDTSGLDALKCEAEGIKKQAEVTAAAATAVGQRRTKYDAARNLYTHAREDAAKSVDASRALAEQLVDRLKCMIDDARVVQRMKDAHQVVREKVEDCGRSTGCCVDDDCEFDTDVAEVPLGELHARLADAQHHITQAEKCFDDLVIEPEQLTKRVTDAKSELAKIGEEMGKDPKGTALERLYARLLIAKQQLDDAWRGFAGPNEYMDCLCRALTCELRAWQARAVFEAAIAVAECRSKAEEERCQTLEENLVEELLAEFDKQGTDRKATVTASA
ncbi:hypothetical protein ACWD3I_20135 [Streptomyces sp. NPDC002817]|uniref:hypothetical protein n=1 Tax=Streptomyces sp. NPDC088357 TaxID=3154655 RepID=UPI0034144D1F